MEIEDSKLQVVFPVDKKNKIKRNKDKELVYAFKEEAKCQICYTNVERILPENAEIASKSMVCIGCEAVCHRVCYGDANTEYEMSKDNKFMFFKCQQCQKNNKKSKCYVCNQGKGLQKQIDCEGNLWAHVACALFSINELEISDYSTMNIILQDKSEIQEEGNQEKLCSICQNPKDIYTCLQGNQDNEQNKKNKNKEKNCQHGVHYYCALQQQKPDEETKQDQQTVDLTQNWQSHIYQSPVPCLKLNIPNTSQQSEQLEQKVTEISEKLNSIFKKELSKENQDIIVEKQKQKIEDAIQKFNQRNELRKKDNKVKQAEKYLQLDYDQDLVGGQRFVYCAQHRTEDYYCVCQNTVSDVEMIACECCLDWYHFVCVRKEFKQDPTEIQDDYICLPCNNWFNFKNKVMLPKINDLHVEIKEIDKQFKCKNNIFDFIQIMMFIDNRIQLLFQDYKQNVLKKQRVKKIKEDYKEIVKYLALYPLKSTKLSLITEFYESIIIQDSMDEIITELLQNYEIPKIKSFIENMDKQNLKNIEINEEIIKNNKENKQILIKVQEFFDEIGIHIEGNFAKQIKYQNWLEHVEKIIRLIKEEGKTIQMHQIDEIISTAEKDQIITEFPNEYDWVDSILEQYKTWQEDIQKYSQTKKQLQEQQQQKEINIINKVKENDKQIKYESYLDRCFMTNKRKLELKFNKTDMEEFIKRGQEISIDCNNEIRILQQEIELADAWEQEHKQIQDNQQQFIDSVNKMLYKQAIATPYMYEVLSMLDKMERFEYKCEKIFKFLDKTDQNKDKSQHLNESKKMEIEEQNNQEQQQQKNENQEIQEKGDDEQQQQKQKKVKNEDEEFSDSESGDKIDEEKQNDEIKQENTNISQDKQQSENNLEKQQNDNDNIKINGTQENNQIQTENSEISQESQIDEYDLVSEVLFEDFDDYDQLIGDDDEISAINKLNYNDDLGSYDYQQYQDDQDDCDEEEMEQIAKKLYKRKKLRDQIRQNIQKERQQIQETRQKAIDIDELKSLQQESSEFPFKLQEQQKLDQLLSDIEKLQKYVSETKDLDLSEQEFKQKKKEFQLFKYDFPEIYEFFDKYELKQKIQSQIQLSTDIEQLRKFLQVSEEQKLSQNIIEELQQKIKIYEELEIDLQKITEKNQFNFEDFTKIQNGQLQTQQNKIKMSQETQQKIYSLKNQEKWVRDIYSYYKITLNKKQKNQQSLLNTIDISQLRQSMSINTEQETKKVEKKQEENKENEKIETEDIENKEIQQEQNKNQIQQDQEEKPDKQQENQQVEIQEDQQEKQQEEKPQKEDKSNEDLSEKNVQNNNTDMEIEKSEIKITEQQQQQQQKQQNYEDYLQIMLEDKEQILQDTIKEFKTIFKNFIKESDKMDICDDRISQLYTKISTSLWHIDALLLLKRKNLIRHQEIEEIWKKSQKYKIDNENENFLKIQEIHQSWSEWQKLYEESFLYDTYKENLDDFSKHENIQQTIQKLRDQKLRVDVQNDLNSLYIIEAQMQWVIKVKTTILDKQEKWQQEIQENQGKTNNGGMEIEESEKSDNKCLQLLYLKEMLDLGKEIEIDIVGCNIYKKLQELQQKYEKIENELNSFYSKLLENNVQMQNIYLNKKSQKQEIIKFNQELKFNYEYALKLIQEINDASVSFYGLEKKLKDEIQKFEYFKVELNTFLDNQKIMFENKTKNNFDIISLDKQQIIQQSKNLKESYFINLSLYDNNLIEKLYEYDFEMEAVSLLLPELNNQDQNTDQNEENQELQQLNNMDQWIDLLKKFETLNNFEIIKKESKIYLELIKEWDQSQELKQKIDEILELNKQLTEARENKLNVNEIRKQLYSKEEFEKIYEQLSQSSIKYQKQQDKLYKFIDKSNQIKQSINGIIEDQKKGKKLESAKVLQKYKEQCKRIPFQMGQAEEQISVYIKNYKQVLDLLQDIKNNKNNSSKLYEFEKKLIEIYQQCPITVLEAENIQKEHKKADIIIQESLKLTQDTNNSKTEQEIYEIQTNFEQLNDKFKNIPESQQVSIQFWIQSIKQIQNKQETSYKMLIGKLEDGYDILYEFVKKDNQEQIKKMKNQVIFLENLLQKCVQEFEKMGQIKDHDKINEFFKYDNFVDMAEEITEYVTDLSLSQNDEEKKNIKLKYEKPIIHNAFDDLQKFKKSVRDLKIKEGVEKSMHNNSSNQTQQIQLQHSLQSKHQDTENEIEIEEKQEYTIKKLSQKKHNQNSAQKSQEKSDFIEQEKKQEENLERKKAKEEKEKLQKEEKQQENTEIEQEDNESQQQNNEQSKDIMNNNLNESQSVNHKQEDDSQDTGNNQRMFQRERSKRQVKKKVDDNFVYGGAFKNQTTLQKQSIFKGPSQTQEKQQQKVKNSKLQNSETKSKIKNNNQDNNQNGDDELDIPSSKDGSSDSDSSDDLEDNKWNKDGKAIKVAVSSQKVQQDDRELFKSELLKSFKSNQVFKNHQIDMQQQITTIENLEYGKSSEKRTDYMKRLKSLKKLFNTLKSMPYNSRYLIRQHFADQYVNFFTEKLGDKNNGLETYEEKLRQIQINKQQQQQKQSNAMGPGLAKINNKQDLKNQEPTILKKVKIHEQQQQVQQQQQQQQEKQTAQKLNFYEKKKSPEILVNHESQQAIDKDDPLYGLLGDADNQEKDTVTNEKSNKDKHNNSRKEKIKNKQNEKLQEKLNQQQEQKFSDDEDNKTPQYTKQILNKQVSEISNIDNKEIKNDDYEEYDIDGTGGEYEILEDKTYKLNRFTIEDSTNQTDLQSSNIKCYNPDEEQEENVDQESLLLKQQQEQEQIKLNTKYSVFKIANIKVKFFKKYQFSLAYTFYSTSDYQKLKKMSDLNQSDTWAFNESKISEVVPYIQKKEKSFYLIKGWMELNAPKDQQQRKNQQKTIDTMDNKKFSLIYKNQYEDFHSSIYCFTEKQMKKYLPQHIAKVQSIQQKEEKIYFIYFIKHQDQKLIKDYLEPIYIKAPLTKEEIQSLKEQERIIQQEKMNKEKQRQEEQKEKIRQQQIKEQQKQQQKQQQFQLQQQKLQEQQIETGKYSPISQDDNNDDDDHNEQYQSPEKNVQQESAQNLQNNEGEEDDKDNQSEDLDISGMMDGLSEIKSEDILKQENYKMEIENENNDNNNEQQQNNDINNNNIENTNNQGLQSSNLPVQQQGAGLQLPPLQQPYNNLHGYGQGQQNQNVYGSSNNQGFNQSQMYNKQPYKNQNQLSSGNYNNSYRQNQNYGKNWQGQGNQSQYDQGYAQQNFNNRGFGNKQQQYPNTKQPQQQFGNSKINNHNNNMGHNPQNIPNIGNPAGIQNIHMPPPPQQFQQQQQQNPLPYNNNSNQNSGRK